MKEYVLRGGEGPARSFGINYQEELNPEQCEVVMAGDGPILVIAGAGSGKTRTVTYRVARLLESGVSPGQILLLTFTNKAAREMLRRVTELGGGDTGILGGTFHHVGNRVLRKHGEKVGINPRFNILDRDDSKNLIGDIISRNHISRTHKKFPRSTVLLDIHSYSINTGMAPDAVILDRYPMFLELRDILLNILRAYGERKRKLGLVDFDDLLTGWRDLVRNHGDVREEQSRMWRHILVDEYQDTNHLQSEIVETISGPKGNLMVVGDDAQSIYAFRGANFGNIIEFPDRFPDCRVFKLQRNYRSTPEVLRLANSSIRNNPRQFHKELQAVLPSGEKPDVVACNDVGEQSRFIAQRMMDFHEGGMPLSEIAVLYRAHWLSMELQMEMTRLGIPFQVRSGLRFFEQAHVKDVAAHLKIVSNPKDELAWKRILKLYPRVGKATAEKIWNVVEGMEDPLPHMKDAGVVDRVPTAGRKAWKEIAGLMDVLRDEEMIRAPGNMIREVLLSGYETYLTAQYPNASARMDDLKRLADYSVRYENLDQLLSELALSNTVAGREAVEAGDGDDAVILSTVHQAKGLEWESVFMLWLVEGKIPDARSLREEGGEEEERRLFYVAATRAKKHLTLVYPTVADERNMMGVVQRPSRFLEELDSSVYEQVGISYSDY